MMLCVYVPVERSVLRSALPDGSALVGPELLDLNEHLPVDTCPPEPGLRWADLVDRAALAHRGRYPKTGRRSVPADQLHQVGWYDELRGEIVPRGFPHDTVAARWLDTPALDLTDLLTTTGPAVTYRQKLNS